MTEAELIQISRDFRRMIEAIPKTRVREHLPVIEQISKLLGRLKIEMYQTPRTSHVSVAATIDSADKIPPLLYSK
jgi:hypothetical protein